MRRSLTDAEAKLWQRLCHHGLGWHFRRQHPIGPYVADFACSSARIVVELDGGQHAESTRDAARDLFMRSKGWMILRFWNPDVLANIDGVLASIRAECLSRAPPPRPSPAARERESG
ncbi:MAG TPA: DUF559 domain-containing protein [Stellaceae bacterium]|nr:DUF559 domain-containing protein [Stellaceae bacterium]